MLRSMVIGKATLTPIKFSYVIDARQRSVNVLSCVFNVRSGDVKIFFFEKKRTTIVEKERDRGGGSCDIEI